MVRLMERDLKLISFLESYEMPMTNLSISKWIMNQMNAFYYRMMNY